MFGLDRFSFGGTYPSMRALLVRLEADSLLTLTTQRFGMH